MEKAQAAQSDFEKRREALFAKLRAKYPAAADQFDELVWLNECIEKQKIEDLTTGPYSAVTQAYEAITIWLRRNGAPAKLKTISDDLIRRGVRAGLSRGAGNFMAAGQVKLGIKPEKAFAREEMPFLCSDEDRKRGELNPLIWLNEDYDPKK